MTVARRILIVCGAGYVSGKEIVTLILANGLRDAGHEVEFVSSNWNDGGLVGRLKDAGFTYYLLRIGFISKTLRLAPLLATLDQLRYWPALLFGYFRLIRRRNPDVVIHTNWHHALLLLPCLKPSRDVFWLHETAVQRKLYGRIFGAIAARTARMICVSKTVADSLSGLGVPEERISVVHNGVAAVDALPPPGMEKALRLGIVGQIGPWKGHDALLAALAHLVRDGEPVTLRIFGAGEREYTDRLKDMISRLGIVSSVAWRGFVRSQHDIYNELDVCMVPSRHDEPLATSAIEAGAYGRPVICFARGGLVDIVQDGETGIVVTSETPAGLAEAVARLARDRDLLRRLGLAARAHISAHFSLASFVRGFEQNMPAMDRSAA